MKRYAIVSEEFSWSEEWDKYFEDLSRAQTVLDLLNLEAHHSGKYAKGDERFWLEQVTLNEKGEVIEAVLC